MKKILIVFSLITLLCLTSCSNAAKSNTQPTNTSQNVSIDYTALIPAKMKSTTVPNMGVGCMIAPYRTDAEMYDVDNAIVIRGEVVDSSYYLDDTASVYTMSEVSIISCYKGDLEESSVIKVREMGGFIPRGVLSNAISLEKFGVESDFKDDTEILDMRDCGNKVMEKGEKVILFLVKADDFYDPLRAWQGKLLYDEDTQLYVPYVPEEEIDLIDAKAYTLEEFESFVETMKK